MFLGIRVPKTYYDCRMCVNDWDRPDNNAYALKNTVKYNVIINY